MVPPTDPSRFAAGELGKGGKNLEEIGAKFLGPNGFGVCLFLMEERLPTFSRCRAIWKFGSKLGKCSFQKESVVCEGVSEFVQVAGI